MNYVQVENVNCHVENVAKFFLSRGLLEYTKITVKTGVANTRARTHNKALMHLLLPIQMHLSQEDSDSVGDLQDIWSELQTNKQNHCILHHQATLATTIVPPRLWIIPQHLLMFSLWLSKQQTCILDQLCLS